MRTSTKARNSTAVPAVEDSRQMCFQQGKPCIYASPDDPGVIITEWPNGTVDHKELATNTRTRRWPDGTIQTGPADAQLTFPHWPRARA